MWATTSRWKDHTSKEIVYGKMCTVAHSKMCMVTVGPWRSEPLSHTTTEKKLGSTSPLFSTFYTSPALIAITKYHLLYKQTSDQFLLAHLWGWDPLPMSFPISWYCKLDTKNAETKTAPWTPNATQRLQVDLLLRLANLTSPVPVTRWK